MSSKSFIYKVLVLLTAALVMNQIACSKSSFESDDGAKSQEAPEPESVDQDFFDTDDDDTGDTGLNDPNYDDDSDYDDPNYEDPTPNDPSHPSCEILSNTGKCYRNVYDGTEGYSYYPIYGDSNRRRIGLNEIEIIQGALNLQIFIDGTRVNYSTTSNDLVRPNGSGEDIIIEFCIY